MRDIFTYPNNPATGYIDPDYYGDNPGFDGFTKRIIDLQLGNYLPWPNLTPPQSGGYPYLGNVTTIGKYYNYYDTVNGIHNLRIYDFWKNPAITGSKKLIDSEIVSSAGVGGVAADSKIAISDSEHDFDAGTLVTISGINGSWNDAGLNDNDYYTGSRYIYANNVVSYDGPFNLHVGAPDGPVIRFREFAQETATNIALGSPVVFTFSALGAPFVDNQEVTITEFDGTLGTLYNGNTFYVQNATATTCTLSSALNDVNPLNLQQEYRDKYTLVGKDGSQNHQIVFVDSQPMVTGDSLTLTVDMNFTLSPYMNSLSVGDPVYLLLQPNTDNKAYTLFKDVGLTQPVTGSTPNSQSSGRTIEYVETSGPGAYVEGGFLNPNPSRQNVTCTDKDFIGVDLVPYEAGWCRFRYFNVNTANAVVTFYEGNTNNTITIPKSTTTWSNQIFWYETSATDDYDGTRFIRIYTDQGKQTQVKALCTNPLQQQGDQGFIGMDFTFLNTWSETIPTDPGALSRVYIEESTTGKLNETVANPADAGEQVLPGPLVAGTTGSIAVATSEPYKYELASVKIEMPGTIAYSYQDSGNNTQFGAEIDTTKYWEEGAATATTFAASGEICPSVTVTVNGSGYLQTAFLNEQPEAEGRFANSNDILFELNALPDQYTPPAPTPGEQQDTWDTDDEWTTPGFDNRKEWPRHVSPASASINLNTPTIVNNSQNGFKYTRKSAFTKWTLDVEYPPMTYDEFQQFHGIAMAAQGQAIPFYFVLRNKDGDSILWGEWYDENNTTTQPLLKEPYVAGDTVLLLEGFSSFESNAFKRGEIFVDGVNQNGNLHTVLNTVDANVFGEAKIRLPMPLRQAISTSQRVFKNPYHAIVTMTSDDFSYTVDTKGYYYMSVSFDLDGFK